MVEANEAEARIERARDEDMKFDRVSTDPRVLHVTNTDGSGDTPIGNSAEGAAQGASGEARGCRGADSGGISKYMIVPEALSCSCPDETYRGTFCKHMIALAMQDSPDGELMREVIGDEYQSLKMDHLEIQEDISRMKELQEEVESEVRALELIRSNLGDVTPQPVNPENQTTEEERREEMEEEVLPAFAELVKEAEEEVVQEIEEDGVSSLTDELTGGDSQ